MQPGLSSYVRTWKYALSSVVNVEIHHDCQKRNEFFVLAFSFMFEYI